MRLEQLRSRGLAEEHGEEEHNQELADVYAEISKEFGDYQVQRLLCDREAQFAADDMRKKVAESC